MPEIFNPQKDKVFSNEIGGKAKGLLFLAKNKFLTPPFFVVDFSTLSKVINETIDLNEILKAWVNSNNIREDALWAVRSSADSEDGATKSFAGFFTTEINVKTNELKKAIGKVLISYSNLKNQEYTSQKKAEFGIIIQEMIRSEYSGVVFSHNPLNVQDDTVHINLIPGIGENLVSGKEEAFSVAYSKGKFNFLNPEDVFSGEVYSNKLHRIEKNGGQIKKEIEPYLPELIKGTEILYRLKKQPIDIEFTIANGVLYWLQIRPITTGKDELFIWDNTNIEGNYPGQTMPLSISFVTQSFYQTYKSMAAYLGMPSRLILENEKFFRNMSGEIHGGLYYNVTSWQKLIYQLPFGKKISRSLPQLWGMEEAFFVPEKNNAGFFTRLKLFTKLIYSFLFFNSIKKKYAENFERSLKEFEKINFNKASCPELISYFYKAESRFGSSWEAPLLNGFFTALFSGILKKVVINSRLNRTYPNFINDILFAQGDVVSVSIVKEFQQIISEIQNDPKLYDMFTRFEPIEIKDRLIKEQTLFNNKIETYIRKYGDRCGEGELKMETVNYKEEPLLFVQFLKENSKHGNIKDRSNPPFSYVIALKKEYPYNFIKRSILKWFIRQTISRVRDRENYRFMRTFIFSLIRKIFRAMDRELLNSGDIKEKNDSLYLRLNEILDAAKCRDFAKIIAARKKEYRSYTDTVRSNRYIQAGKKFTEVAPPDFSGTDKVLSGTGCCSGIVKAQIKIINDKNDEDGGHVGKILVANYFEPGKINLFSQAAGIISVRGNLLSHTGILCREMGIPSIVGAKGLLSKVKNDDWIEMNGSTGKIKLFLTNE